MGIAYPTSVAATPSSTTSITLDIDCGSGADRVLYVGVSHSLTRTLDTTTVGASSLALVSNVDDRAYLFRCISPPDGTQTVTVAHSAGTAGRLRMLAVLVTGISTTDPDDTPVTQSVTSVTDDQSTNVPTVTGDSVLSFARVRHTSGGGTITSLNNSIIDQDNANESTGFAYDEDAVEVTMGWSFTGDGSGGATFSQICINLNVAGAVAYEPVTGTNRFESSLQGVGIHRTITPGIAQLYQGGFTGAILGAGYHVDGMTGYINIAGTSTNVTRELTIPQGIVNQQGLTPNIGIIRTFLSLLGEIRQAGFAATSVGNQQTYTQDISQPNTVEGFVASITTSAPPSTQNITAQLRVMDVFGLVPFAGKVHFPIMGERFIEGLAPLYIELVNVIDGPTTGIRNVEGFAAAETAIGQIRQITASLGERAVVGLQQAIAIHRTLEQLLGTVNVNGEMPNIAIVRGSTIDLPGLLGSINLEGLVATIQRTHTALAETGLSSIEGFASIPEPGLNQVQSILSEIYLEGLIPLISTDRFFGLLGTVHTVGLAADVSTGFWSPVRRRATTWVSN